jgi:NADPH-dependent F420 reductase
VSETVNPQAIAILGGTGDQGLGLALRFAAAGRPVVIGSRKLERAVEAAEKVRAAVSGADVRGLENAAAAAAAPVVILSVPFEHTAATVKQVAGALAPGQIVVSMGVPLATAVGDGAVRTVGVWQGSCAELVASLLPAEIPVVSAFQNVSAHRLQELGEPVDCDVVVSGAKGPRKVVMDLCPLVPGLRAVDGGPLANARIVEALTALMIGINVRYKLPEGSGIRFTGLPDA